jgi:hypothetical protein
MSERGFLEFARDAIRAGMRVIPVATSSLPLVELAEASVHEDTLLAWAAQFPDAVVGVVQDGRVVELLGLDAPAGDSVDQAVAIPKRHAVPQDPSVRIIRMADVVAQQVRWLWPGRIPLGMLALLDGDPGLGKSTVTLDLAARLSRGDAMPDGAPGPGAAGAVVLSAEDDLSRVIRPRLEAAKADLKLIATVQVIRDGVAGDPLIHPEDLARVEKAMVEVSAKLLVVDPLVAYLPDGVSANRDQDVRRALAMLRKVAESTGATVLVIRHLRKSGASNPVYRGGGSIGIIGAARTGLLVAPDPDDPAGRRILAWTKLNVAAMPQSWAFRLDQALNCSQPHVVWEGASEYDAESLLATKGEKGEPGALEEAIDFLDDQLGAGAVPAADVVSEAQRAGIAPATLNRAKKRLGVISAKTGGPGQRQAWNWSLPGAETSGPAAELPEPDHLQTSATGNPFCDGEQAEGDHPHGDGHLRLITFAEPAAPAPGVDAAAAVDEPTPCPDCGGRRIPWSFGVVCTVCRRRFDAGEVTEQGRAPVRPGAPEAPAGPGRGDPAAKGRV